MRERRRRCGGSVLETRAQRREDDELYRPPPLVVSATLANLVSVQLESELPFEIGGMYI